MIKLANLSSYERVEVANKLRKMRINEDLIMIYVIKNLNIFRNNSKMAENKK